MDLDLRNQHGVGPIGEPIFRITTDKLDAAYSMTMLVKYLDDDSTEVPVVLDIREDTNTQWDFCTFLIFALEHSHLKAGDYLVLDNAAVHVGEKTVLLIADICAAAGVTIKFLPAYSPELNPIELLFGYIKRHLREYRDNHGSLWIEIGVILTTVPNGMIRDLYHKCGKLLK